MQIQNITHRIFPGKRTLPCAAFRQYIEKIVRIRRISDIEGGSALFRGNLSAAHRAGGHDDRPRGIGKRRVGKRGIIPLSRHQRQDFIPHRIEKALLRFRISRDTEKLFRLFVVSRTSFEKKHRLIRIIPAFDEKPRKAFMCFIGIPLVQHRLKIQKRMCMTAASGDPARDFIDFPVRIHGKTHAEFIAALSVGVAGTVFDRIRFHDKLEFSRKTLRLFRQRKRGKHPSVDIGIYPQPAAQRIPVKFGKAQHIRAVGKLHMTG